MLRYVLLLILGIASARALSADDFSLCTSKEINYSSCRIGEKVASFCASEDINANGGYFQYRFGTKEEVELEYPETKLKRGPFFQAFQLFTDGDVHYTAFVIGSYRYVYYERQINGRPEMEGRSENGLAIVKNGTMIKDWRCDAMSDGTSGPGSRPLDFPNGIFVSEDYVDF